MPFIRNNLQATDFQVRPCVAKVGMALLFATTTASGFSAKAAVELGGDIAMVDEIPVEAPAVSASTIEVIAPIGDQTLGVIIFHINGNNLGGGLSFGGPR